MRSFLFFLTILALFSSCNDSSPKTDDKGTTQKNNASKEPPVKPISYSIIKTFPHNTSSFTQGLIIYKGDLYEGTGERGHSKLMKVDLGTGNTLKEISLAREYFGEGITILRDTVYQLTWEEHVVFAYDLKTFKKLKEYSISTEGWGITTNGSELIVSDGTSNLYFYEPGSFRLLRKQPVFENGELSYNLNELEFIDGFVYANQWQYPYILKIDPATGKVVAKADMQEIWTRVKIQDPQVDVPNGIAYDTATHKMYITGKRWPLLFEVQFSN